MNPRRWDAWYFIAWVISLLAMALLLSSPVAAEPGQFIVSPVAEKKLNGLPPGPLDWRIENFPALDQAQSAAALSPTSLAAAVSGKVWLFTLARRGAPRPAAPKSPRLVRCQSSPRPNICCGSITLAVRPAPKHRCIHIPAQSHSMCLLVRSAKERRTGKPHGNWSDNGRPRPRHADGSGEQRDDRPRPTGDDSVGCGQTGLGASQV